MSASDSELEAAAEDGLVEDLARVTEYRIGNGGRSVRVDAATLLAKQKILMEMRGLASPLRGNTLGRIDRPA
jgi:hypothetical protein